jgi:hypothetical protein
MGTGAHPTTSRTSPSLTDCKFTLGSFIRLLVEARVMTSRPPEEASRIGCPFSVDYADWVSRLPAILRATFSVVCNRTRADVRFSNRPIEVKRFQAVQRCSVDVARGLALLFGLGTKALPAWGSKTRWNNLSVGLAVGRTAGSSGHTNSPHPSSREGHHSTTRWSSSFLLSSVITFMPLRPSGSSGTRCRQPRCDA